MSNRIMKNLKRIGVKGISVDMAKNVGINILELIHKGLVKREKKKIVRYIVPENAPRWATKFKFSRKRHGIEEDIKETTILKLTNKGYKLMKSKPKKDDEKEEETKDEKPSVADDDSPSWS